MHEDSPNRFDRIVSILIQLQSKKIVRAQELADRFEVSLRTIYRDIRSLEVAGVPLYGEAGSGYSLVDGYRLPPVMFSPEEASSFIAAEKLMTRFGDRELESHYQSALFKIKSVLRGDEKELISQIESRVMVRNPEQTNDHLAPNALATVFRAIGQRVQLRLLYEALASEQPQQRTIEPIGVYQDSGRWYLFGFCHLRQDYRQFRTDRIHNIEMTSLEFTRPHRPLETYLQPEKHPTTRVRILVDPEIVKYIKSDRKNYGFVSERQTPKGIEMIFESRDPENGFGRWFMMFADFATILEPDWLNDTLTGYMQQAQARMKKRPQE